MLSSSELDGLAGGGGGVVLAHLVPVDHVVEGGDVLRAARKGAERGSGKGVGWGLQRRGRVGRGRGGGRGSISPPVLVLEVVRVLPDVDAHDGDLAGLWGRQRARERDGGSRHSGPSAWAGLFEAPAARTFGSISGLSWLGVVTIETAPFLSVTSHAQPEPKTPAAEAENFALKSSYEPNALSIAAPRSPEGAPPALGPMMVQKRQWL